MAKLLECIKELFETNNLYDVLQIKSNASTSEIKKAYYKMSLKVHPDRSDADDREAATRKFQSLSQVYSILSNADKRALYDETGEIDDEADIFQDNRNWESYWRVLFKEITIADIEAYESKYRFSEEEAADVITAYEQCEGDMDMILETVPCSIVEDDERFKRIIDDKIKTGECKIYEAFKKESAKKQSKRRKLASLEAEEAAKVAKEAKLGEEADDLKKMLMKRQEDRAKEMNSFFDHLESKYGKTNKKAKTSRGKKKK